MRALILCAGKATRLGYKTKPKCMAIVNKKPVLEHLVNHLNKHGITEIIVNIHKNYEKIFKYFGTRLLYLYEPTLLGEAGTEKILQNWLGDNYIVMNGDTLTNLDIGKVIEENMIFWDFEKDCFAGTNLVNKRFDTLHKWDGDGAFYFDIGTKEGLRKARKFYARQNTLP